MTTLENLITALEASWGADTAFTKSDWSSENPARGQCVVSSLVVQDYFGGDLLKYSVTGKGIEESHYFNQIADGNIVDVTKGQYNFPVSMKPSTVSYVGFASIREKRLSDDDTRQRYRLLKDRVELHLQT